MTEINHSGKPEKISIFKQWGMPLWLHGLMLFLASLLVTGYRIYYGNQSITIPLVQSINNPSLFPNDPFVSTLVHYAAPLWRGIALLASYVPIEIILTILFIATRALVLIAAGNLAMTINPESKLAAVGAMAFFALWPIALLAHGTLVTNYFEQTSLAIAIILFATAAFYTKHRLYWALWLALGFTLNSMYGVYACSFFAAVFLIDRSYRCEWKKWVLPGSLFVILIIPTLWLSLSAIQINTISNDIWLLATESRFPMHLYPHTWNPPEFYVYFGFMLLSTAAFFFNRRSSEQLFLHNIVWLAVAFGWLVLAFLAAYIFRSPTMLVMHPARGTDLWLAFAGIALIAVLANRIEAKPSHWQLFIPLFFISILWQKVFDDYLIILPFWIFITIAAFWRPALRYVFSDGDSGRISNIALITVLGFAFYQITKAPDPFNLDTVIHLPDPQIQEIARWAKENTSVDSVFLIEPNWDEFRALSQRPVYVTYKDGAAILWERSYVEEWVPRMDSLGYNFVKPHAIGISTSSYLQFVLGTFYGYLGDKDILMLAKKYPLRYWVVPATRNSSFPMVFRTLEYKVLEIEPIVVER